MTNLVRLQHGAAAALAFVILCVADVAAAQNYPNRVIKIIVPFGPGGQPDVVARVFAQHLAATLGA
jgi:tripartite-type tricarboxylate transporter receptor subunit TctC